MTVRPGRHRRGRCSDRWLAAQPGQPTPPRHDRRPWVTGRASRWPSVSSARCSLVPFLPLAPSSPARAPLLGEARNVRLSRIAALGWHPAAKRRTTRRSAASATKQPATSQRGAGRKRHAPVPTSHHAIEAPHRWRQVVGHPRCARRHDEAPAVTTARNEGKTGMLRGACEQAAAGVTCCPACRLGEQFKVGFGAG